MRTPRFIAHIHAWLGSYFWLPCPVCSGTRKGKRRCKKCERQHQQRIRATPEYKVRHAKSERERRAKRKESL